MIIRLKTLVDSVRTCVEESGRDTSLHGRARDESILALYPQAR
jgi:hypothetical protein